MKIAYTMAPGRGDTDLLLFQLADELAARKVRCSGTVQINTNQGVGPCDMDVKVLPTGPILRISQSLGRASRGCRLDPAVLEQAVGLVEADRSRSPDILIINKFGKHEADGRGFRHAIGQAVAQDIPVLVGVNALNLKAFAEFTGGASFKVEAKVPKLLNWCQDAIGEKKNAA